MSKKLTEDEALKMLLSYMGQSKMITDTWDFDITFCANKECHLFSKCLRNSDRLKNHPYQVSMCGFKPDENGKCENYIPLKQSNVSE
jgi:hypothetical protein